MRCVRGGMLVAIDPTAELPVPVCLRPLPVETLPFLDVSVVVVLVDDRRAGSHVDHGKPQLECATDHPVVPAGPADRERRQAEVELARIDEVVASKAEIQLSVSPCPLLQSVLVGCEVNRRTNVAVPTLADREVGTARETADGADEIVEEDDVCVDVAEDLCRAPTRRLRKGPIQ